MPGRRAALEGDMLENVQSNTEHALPLGRKVGCSSLVTVGVAGGPGGGGGAGLHQKGRDLRGSPRGG